jgi:hypothetical protein
MREPKSPLLLESVVAAQIALIGPSRKCVEGLVLRTIVHYDDLEISEGLVLERSQAEEDSVRSLIGYNDDRNHLTPHLSEGR